MSSSYGGGSYRGLVKQTHPSRQKPQKNGRKEIRATLIDRLRLRSRRRRSVFLRPSKGGTKVHYWKLMGTVDYGIKIGRKTVGFIAGKNLEKPFAHAISGSAGCQKVGVLDNSIYTNRVSNVAEAIGFRLRQDVYDRTTGARYTVKEGKYDASHIEKQLAVKLLELAMAYVRRHQPGRCDKNLSILDRITDLKTADLPDYLRNATIQLDHRPCNSCLRFLEMIESKTNIEIDVNGTKFMIVGKREKEGMKKPQRPADAGDQPNRAKRPRGSKDDYPKRGSPVLTCPSSPSPSKRHQKQPPLSTPPSSRRLRYMTGKFHIPVKQRQNSPAEERQERQGHRETDNQKVISMIRSFAARE